jgi:hypothetical protein
MMRSVWLKVAIVGLLTLAASCLHGPPPDPLAIDRQRLMAVADEPLAPDFEPQARLILSPALLRDAVQDSLDDAAGTVEALRFMLPFVGEVALRPSLTVRGVRAEPEPACVGCVALLVDLVGTVTPVNGGGMLPGLRFSGSARGVFALKSVPVRMDNGDTVMEVRAIADAATDTQGGRGWTASVTLDDLPAALSQSVSSSVTALIQRLMGSEARSDLLLASLPGDGPVRLRGVRPGANNGAIIVDIAFVVIDAGVVDGNLPPVTSGFALQVPEQTVLALARAETLRMKPRDGYVVDPQRIVVDEQRFALEVAVIKLDREPTRRDVRVSGTIALDGTTLHIVPEQTEQVARQGGFDPFELIVRGAILEKVETSLRLAVPMTRSTAEGGRRRQTRLTSLTDLGDVIQIGGETDRTSQR